MIVFDFRYPGAPPQSTGPFAGGSVPPTPIVGASGERSAAAGSDRKDIPPNPVSALPANVAPPVGRNVTGSDNKARSRPRRPEDSDEQESVFSKESEKRSHRSKRHKSLGLLKFILQFLYLPFLVNLLNFVEPLE